MTHRSTALPSSRQPSRSHRRSHFIANRQLYAMLLLPIGFFLIFRYLPMFGLVIAFQDYNLFRGVFHSRFVGFEVFEEILKMRGFWLALRNTLMLNGVGLVVGFPAPIVLAILLNEMRRKSLKRVYQSVLYLPHFLSWVIVGAMAVQLFSDNTGLVNNVIARLGGQRIPFLSHDVHWVATYTAIGVWKSAGWGTIIYLSALTGVNPELYEALEVDGGGRWAKIVHVTLPGIRSTMVVLLVLTVGRLINIGFEQPFILGNLLVRNVADVISTFVYRVGLQAGRFSIGTAVGLFQSVAGVILLLAANRVAAHMGESHIW